MTLRELIEEIGRALDAIGRGIGSVIRFFIDTPLSELFLGFVIWAGILLGVAMAIFIGVKISATTGRVIDRSPLSRKTASNIFRGTIIAGCAVLLAYMYFSG